MSSEKLMVISYYTPDPYYKELGESLRKSCEKYGVDNAIAELPSRGEWIKNINLSPGYINDCMMKYNRPLLWIDADSVLIQFPNLFRSKPDDCDMVLRVPTNKRERMWTVGVMYINNTTMSKAFLKRWAALTEKDKGNGLCSDEYYFDRTWREMGHLMKVYSMPGEYTFTTKKSPGCVIKDGLSGNASAVARKKKDQRVKAYWSKSPQPGNLGDILTPWMIRRETEEWPIEGGKDSMMCSGSILSWSAPGATVWGSGVFRMDETISPELNILATRGPLSAEVARKNGYELPEVYGDPGLLLPYFYNRPTEPSIHNIGIVPHYVDFAHADDMFEDREDVSVINPLTFDLWKTVDEIRQCELILSSSLHGLVVAAAYGIPNAWINFPYKPGRLIAGDGTKYRDFYLSVGRVVNDSQKIVKAEDANKIRYEETGDVLPLFDDLWECCPFRLDNL